MNDKMFREPIRISLLRKMEPECLDTLRGLEPQCRMNGVHTSITQEVLGIHYAVEPEGKISNINCCEKSHHGKVYPRLH